MKSVEFIGPSGIGKTTFLQNLVKLRGDSAWITRREGLRLIRQGNHNIPGKIFAKIAGLAGISLKRGKRRSHVKMYKERGVHCSVLIELFLQNLQNSELASWQKARLYEYYMVSVLPEIITILEASGDRTVVFDEGIVHNGGVISVLNHFEKFSRVTGSKFFPKGVIFCKLNKDQFRKRIHSRFIKRGERKINSLYTEVTEPEVERYLIRAKEEAEQCLKACKLLGIPILEIEPAMNANTFDRTLKFIDSV